MTGVTGVTDAPARSRWRRPAAIAGALVGVAVLAGACGSGTGGGTAAGAGGGGTSTTVAAAGTTPGTAAGTTPGSTAPSKTAPPASPVRFTTETRTLVDTSRPTEAGAQTPAAPERTLRTTVRIPEGTGRAPLIVFSHGLWGHPDKFTQLLDTWAAAGFVVAAPAFPLTNDKVPGAPQNWTGLAHQPGDVSFVIDQLLAADDDATDPLHGRIDADRIGAGGLSLGGATTYAVTFNDCCRDRRVRAAMVLSGALLPPGSGDYHLDGHVPLLIVHGDKDGSLPYAMAVDAYTQAVGPVWFVTFQGGTHAPPFEDDPAPPFDALADRLTTTWWTGWLWGDAAARDRFPADAVVDGVSTLQTKPTP